MSYILDALKKADSERKKGNVYADATLSAPYAMPLEKSKPKMWYWLLALNFVILASILGISIYLYHAYFSKPITAPSTQTLAQSPSQNLNTIDLAKEPSNQNTSPNKAPEKALESMLDNKPVINNAPIVLSGYPEKLDVHVFSKQLDKRFVMIKGAVLMVGDKVDGWQLININVDGAEFEKEGQKVSVSAKP